MINSNALQVRSPPSASSAVSSNYSSQRGSPEENYSASQLRRLMASQQKKVVLKPKQTWRQRLKFYVTFLMSLVLIAASTIFLFVVPFVVDPALSTLMADFPDDPVACITEKSEFVQGIHNCSWSSCREGCTADAYNCTHVFVRYTHIPFQQLFPSGIVPSPSSSPVPSSPGGIEDWEEALTNGTEGVLLINIKGCGYPPQVECERFREQYAVTGHVFPCFFSNANHSLVMPSYDRHQQVMLLTYSLLIPLGSSAVALTVLVVLHSSIATHVRKMRRRAQIHDQRPWSSRMDKLRRHQSLADYEEPT